METDVETEVDPIQAERSRVRAIRAVFASEFPEIERWHTRLNELPAWREPFPKEKAAAA